ncbi:hypothetical protein [Clostridium sp. D53t1_180928_C8]|uniref:hypothetical protein n=1 Tax=Clostridium sp. D53t1_180928_C8 TaxID=2787101 RepID=UPI0018AA11D8|nr:hypothetical protein [Clostridium sp. D53t1_180928_C8]
MSVQRTLIQIVSITQNNTELLDIEKGLNLYKSINKGLGYGKVTINVDFPIKILCMKLQDAEKHFNKCTYGEDFSIDKKIPANFAGILITILNR